MAEKDLIPINKRTKEVQKEITSKGGKKSAENRRKKKLLKDRMKMLLELPVTDVDDWNEASVMGIDMSEIDNEMLLIIGLYKKAKTGDVGAFKEIRNLIGQDLAAQEQQLRIEKLKAETAKLKGTDNENELNKLDDVLGNIKGVV